MSNVTRPRQEAERAEPRGLAVVRVRLREYARLMRLDRPIGIWLLLWPALWALWIAADGQPDERIFVIFVMGTFVMRSAGCVINDFADREFDPHVRRTADRPLARQAVSPAEALALFAVLGLIALALLIPLNRPTQVLALIGGVLAVTYPFLKRFFALPQAYLGAGVRLVRADGVRGADRRSCRRQAWVLFRRGACSGPPRTTRSTRWSTARTTSSSASGRPRSCSGVRTARIVAVLQAGGARGPRAGRRDVRPRPLVLVRARASRRARGPPAVADPRARPGPLLPRVPDNNLFGLAVFAGILLDYLFAR